jgi:hypothetical protein
MNSGEIDMNSFCGKSTFTDLDFTAYYTRRELKTEGTLIRYNLYKGAIIRYARNKRNSLPVFLVLEIITTELTGHSYPPLPTILKRIYICIYQKIPISA